MRIWTREIIAICMALISVLISGCTTRKGAMKFSLDVAGDKAIAVMCYGDSPGGVLYSLEKSAEDKWEIGHEMDLGKISRQYRFGVAVAVSDSHVVIGADAKQGYPGAVAVLEFCEDSGSP